MTSDASEGPRILGTLRSENGVGVVRIEERFDATIDEVWSALTDPARLAQWYGEIEGDLRLGGEFHSRLYASGWDGTRRVTACDPPHGFTLGAEDDVSEVTLRADGDQTVIVYENRSVPLDLLFAYGAGEQIHVEDLGAHLAGREREGAGSRWDALESAYRPLAEQVGPQR
ncbi:MAG TPA: SRPBCC domain-containing protein [Gaiellaceae bacterium]|nr:SRPBCC domain-containing protein [Gaiellaceae bacterium]